MRNYPLWIGSLVWLGWLLLDPLHGDLDRIARILGLAVLIGIPLALPFTGKAPPFVVWFQLPAALLAVVSLSLAPGSRAACLALPWLVETLLLAAWGVRRLRPTAAESLISVGLVYLPVGGLWLMASRYGYGPLGFQEPIVLLTAVHFHFAGCLAPCLTGVIGRALPPDSIREKRETGRPAPLMTPHVSGRGETPRLPLARVYRILAVGVGLGPPLVAAGITFANWVEPIAGALLGSCLFGVAVLALWKVVPRLPGVVPKLGLATAGLCGILAMLMAVSFAMRSICPQYALAISDMIPTHGLLNSVGFTLLGLLSLRRHETAASSVPPAPAGLCPPAEPRP